MKKSKSKIGYVTDYCLQIGFLPNLRTADELAQKLPPHFGPKEVHAEVKQMIDYEIQNRYHGF